MVSSAVSTFWSNTPRSRYSSSNPRTSASVKPSSSAKSDSRLMLLAMLKPLVTSSRVMGETPVMNSRSMPPPCSVPAFRVAKKAR